MNIQNSYFNTVRQHQTAIADYSRMINYQTGKAGDDLIHELKALYETEKQKLEQLWKRIADKGADFLAEIWAMVKDFAEELAQDIVKFLEKHGLHFIIDLLKEIF